MTLHNPRGFASALAVIAGAIAAAITPATALTPSQWAAQNLVVVEGPYAGQFWDPSRSPGVAAIIDEAMCGAACVVTVRKSAQTGFTQGLIAVSGWIACEAPARTLHVLPTAHTVGAYNREKLQPSIDASPVLKYRIADITTRGKSGSSTSYKAFPGGSIAIVSASSAPDLQMHTVKIAVCDEIDQWLRDLAGQGSPMGMVDARQISFHATRDYKKLQGGTPTEKGASLVDSEFERGDQRYWKMPCVHCGEKIRFEFGGYAGEPGGTGLRFNRQRPVEAHYIAPCCGGIIEHWQKTDMVRAGAFVADRAEFGRHPSFHIDSLSSLFTTWDKIAETFLDAGDDPQKQKNFVNLWLGLPYEEKSDAPDWQNLFKRRESYGERVIPDECLIVTCGVDVQKRGLYAEIVGWTPDRRSRTLYAEYLPAGAPDKPGDTSDPDDDCWKRLTALFEKPLTQEHGGERRIDALGIDCRFNAPVVYDWTRRHHGAYALRTEEGWGRPPMGAAQYVDFDWRGRRIKRGVMQWKVGSYNLKSRFYAYLRRETSIEEGAVVAPPGFCHFGTFLGEPYFRQLCAEYVGVDKTGARIWKQRGDDNHFLDTRVLNMALAFGPIYDIEHRDENFWRALAAERGVTLADESLFAPLPGSVSSPDPAAHAAREAAPAASAPDEAPLASSGAWNFQGRWI